MAKGFGTTADIKAASDAIDLDIPLPARPIQEPDPDPLPSLREGEGMQLPMTGFERLGAAIFAVSPTFNTITGLMDEYSPERDPNFDMRDHTDALAVVSESNWDYLLDSVSEENLEHRKNELLEDEEHVRNVMKGGTLSGIGYMMFAGGADYMSVASMYMDGPMGLFKVAKDASRAAKIMNMAMRAGVPAAGETAVLAYNKATMGTKDVLYGFVGGSILGAGIGAAVTRKGFGAAADAMQNKFLQDVQDELDMNLIEASMIVKHKPTKYSFGMKKADAPVITGDESQSILGKYDPDDVAQRLAEEGADDVPTAPVDEAAGIADAYDRNLQDKIASGEFNPEETVKSRIFKILSRNPFQSNFIRGLKSKSKKLQNFTLEILEDASGLVSRKETAAMMFHKDARKLLEDVMPKVRQGYKDYAKANGIRWATDEFFGDGKIKFNLLLRDELTKIHNASTKGIEYLSNAPEYIQDAAKAWNRGMDDAVSLASKHRVRGFDEFKAHPGYVPLSWLGNKLAIMSSKDLGIYEEVITLGYTKMGHSQADAAVFTKALLNRQIKKASGVDTNPGALLAHDSREYLKEVLEINGLNPEQIKAMFGRIDVTLANRGKSARAKGRVPIDLSARIGEYRLTDIIENDLDKLGTQYFTEIAGRSALARKGIRHDGAWRAITDSIKKDVLKNGDPGEIEQVSEMLDSLYMQFLGRPVGDGIHKGTRRLQEFAMNTMLGMVGTAQAAESGNIFAAHGIKDIFRYSSEIRRFRNALKTGSDAKGMLGELQAHLGGMWGEHKFFRTGVRLDDATGEATGMWKVLDNTLAASSQVLGHISGLNWVKEFQQQFTAVSQANKVIKMLQSGEDTPRLLKRFADVGWDERTLNRFKKYADDGTITFQKNGSIDMLNLDKWNPRDVELFSIGMHRHSAQLIQFPLIGETAYWQHKTMGSTLSQFRTFSMLSVEKQAARQINMADAEAVGAMTHALGLSTLIYMAKVHAVSIGRHDREEYLEKRLSPGAIINGGIQYSSVYGALSDVINLAAAVGALPADYGSGFRGGTGGGAFSLDKQVPAFAAAASAQRITSGMLTALSPLSDNKFDKNEVNDLVGALLLGNSLPGHGVKNVMHRVFDDR